MLIDVKLASWLPVRTTIGWGAVLPEPNNTANDAQGPISKVK